MLASFQPSISLITFAQRCEYLCHWAIHSSDATWVCSVGIEVNFLSAVRSLSIVAMRGSITHWTGANLMSAFTERDNVVRPMTIATCGINTLRISMEVKKMDA